MNAEAPLLFRYSALTFSCLDFVALVHEAGRPEDWCQSFIPESTDLAENLATDPLIAFLSFIGSAKVDPDAQKLIGVLRCHGSRWALSLEGLVRSFQREPLTA